MSNKPTLNQHEISNLKIPYLTIVTTLELRICLWTSQATRGVFVTLGLHRWTERVCKYRFERSIYIVQERVRNFSLTQVGNYAKPGPSSRILNDDERTKKNNEKKGESRPQEVPESHLGCRLHHGKNWSDGLLQRVERSVTKTVRKSHKPERRNLSWLMEADDKLACDDMTAELLDANKLEFEVKLRVSNIKKILGGVLIQFFGEHIPSIFQSRKMWSYHRTVQSP